MEIIKPEQAKKIKFKKLSIALGTFDGLHIGHMKLIEAVKACSGKSAAFTFKNLPSDLFIQDHKPMHLFTLEEKLNAFNKTGIDYLCITTFDRKFASIDKSLFESLLEAYFSPDNVVVGYNFTYGKHALGNVDTLKEFGDKHGCNIDIIPPVIFDGEPVSSTRIRECIEAGSIERANALLGYTYNITGSVEKGEGLGNKLGFPTANIKVPKEKAIPLRGVYSIDALYERKSYKGVCNIGVRPTVSNNSRESIEAHLLSLSEDIYGKEITIFFNKRLRDEIKFSSQNELIEQIKRDIKSI
jgi:riboflavin kinase / FMN adenylyltransferase